jgi:toxin ParE1/3/4
MIIVIGSRARADLAEIGDHIALDNPMRAFTFVDELEARCGALDPHPQRFPLAGRFDGRPVHKLSHAGYLIFYVLTASRIEVLRIIHGSRDWLGMFES